MEYTTGIARITRIDWNVKIKRNIILSDYILFTRTAYNESNEYSYYIRSSDVKTTVAKIIENM